MELKALWVFWFAYCFSMSEIIWYNSFIKCPMLADSSSTYVSADGNYLRVALGP
jgi:hypothetical protein